MDLVWLIMGRISQNLLDISQMDGFEMLMPEERELCSVFLIEWLNDWMIEWLNDWMIEWLIEWLWINENKREW